MPPSKTSAPAREEVERALERISNSRALSGSARLVRFLRYVVEKRLNGDQARIQEYSIGLDVYDRGESFDPKADSIVRGEARRLRKALQKYYDSEGLEDPVVIRVPRGGYVPTFEARASDSSWMIAALVSAGALTVLLAGAWAWRGDQAQEAPAAVRKLVQLTADPGLSAWPDITADGNIVVYSSDRDGGPDLDLWLRYVDRDEALQITDEPGDEIEASISPDGSLISYTSLPSESILTVPTLGGTPRLIAKKGKFPQFSPVGKSIAFSRGRSGWSNDLVIHVLDTGRQTVYGESMNWLGNGVLWLPDGTLLSGGVKAGRPDWWTVPLDGSETIGAQNDGLEKLSIGRPPPFAAQAWLAPEGGLLFAARKGDSIDIWMRRFDLESRRVHGEPIQITRGASMAHDVTTSAGGRIVYASYEQSISLWRLPMEIDQGRPAGPIELLTPETGSAMSPSGAIGANAIVYRKALSPESASRSQLVLRRLEGSPDETVLLQGRAAHYRSPVLDTAAKRLAYVIEISSGTNKFGVARPDLSNVFQVDLAEQAPKIVCEACPTMWSISPDGRYRLHRGADNNQKEMDAYEVETGRRTTILSHDGWDLTDGRISPDGDYIAFRATVSGAHKRQAFVARFDPGLQARQPEWISLAPKASYVGGVEWAPSGRLLYYHSDEGERMSLRAIRFDRDTGKPAGDSWVVYDGTEGGGPLIQSWMVTGIATYRLAVMPDALIFDAVSQRGNLWMLDPIPGE